MYGQAIGSLDHAGSRRKFADPQIAHDFLVAMRWPNGVACPRCGDAQPHYLGDKYRRWLCKECQRQFTAKVGTVFKDSPFDKWMPAIWLISSNRNGISSCELACGLGVNQKTARFMFHRVRTSLANESLDQLRGIIEATETTSAVRIEASPSISARIGPWLRSGSTIRLSFSAWSSAAVAFVPNVLPARTSTAIIPRLRAQIHQDATLFADAHHTYKGVDEFFLRHDAANHSMNTFAVRSMPTPSKSFGRS